MADINEQNNDMPKHSEWSPLSESLPATMRQKAILRDDFDIDANKLNPKMTDLEATILINQGFAARRAQERRDNVCRERKATTAFERALAGIQP